MSCTTGYQPFYSYSNPIVIGSIFYTNAAGTIKAGAGYYRGPGLGDSVYQIDTTGKVIDIISCLEDQCNPWYTFQAQSSNCPCSSNNDFNTGTGEGDGNTGGGVVGSFGGGGSTGGCGGGTTVKSRLSSLSINKWYKIGNCVYKITGPSTGQIYGTDSFNYPVVGTAATPYDTCTGACSAG